VLSTQCDRHGRAERGADVAENDEEQERSAEREDAELERSGERTESVGRSQPLQPNISLTS